MPGIGLKGGINMNTISCFGIVAIDNDTWFPSSSSSSSSSCVPSILSVSCVFFFGSSSWLFNRFSRLKNGASAAEIDHVDDNRFY